MFYAHSTQSADKRDWQELAEHCLAVARLAECFGRRLGIGRAAMLAGLLHDLGKYNPMVQKRIAGANIRVDHSTAGAALVGEGITNDKDKVAAELIAYAIAGHHAGLPDKINANGGLELRLRDFDATVLDAIWRTELSPDLGQSSWRPTWNACASPSPWPAA